MINNSLNHVINNIFWPGISVQHASEKWINLVMEAHDNKSQECRQAVERIRFEISRLNENDKVNFSREIVKSARKAEIYRPYVKAYRDILGLND